MVKLQSGGCLCGAVRYEINLDGAETGNCHCRDCQKNSGGAFMPFTTVDAGQLRWISAPTGATKASDTAERRFCASCGTPLTWEGKNYQHHQSVSTGTLDDVSGIEIAFEIYTRSRWPALPPVPGARQYLADDITGS